MLEVIVFYFSIFSPSLLAMSTAPQESLKTLTAVLHISNSRSNMSKMGRAAIRPTCWPFCASCVSRDPRMTTMATREALGTPATPMLVTNAMITIKNCWLKLRSTPRAWQIKMAATHSYRAVPSILTVAPMGRVKMASPLASVVLL